MLWPYTRRSAREEPERSSIWDCRRVPTRARWAPADVEGVIRPDSRTWRSVAAAGTLNKWQPVAVIPDGLAPPPTELDGRVVVAGELRSLEGRLHFDVDRRRVHADVSALIGVSSPGWPAWDLRQPLGRSPFAHVDLGGGPGAEMRLLDRPLEPGDLYRLDLSYGIDAPLVADPLPIAWGEGTVGFDVWCSDLAPGRYLEQWLPVGLCQDCFSLSLEVEITGAKEPHAVIANGQIDGEWRIRWPDHHTSLSSLLMIAPASSLVSGEAGPVRLTAEASLGIDPVEEAERAAAYLEAYSSLLGPYRHGSRFLAHLWGSTRGMEYDGAASASVKALEHEVFHSWFGRGVKPATASDGWIDEAITSAGGLYRRRPAVRRSGLAHERRRRLRRVGGLRGSIRLD